jgi:leucyl-tRNA synthetase
MPLESDSEPLAIVISPYAPHTEELWSILGHRFDCISSSQFFFEAKHLESEKEYPVSFNEKCVLPLLCLDLKEQIEEIVMKDERTIKQLEGKTPNKVIIVPEK